MIWGTDSYNPRLVSAVVNARMALVGQFEDDG